MKPTNRKGRSGGSGTVSERVAKSSVYESTGISADSPPADDDKEFQRIMAIVMDLKRELEHGWKLREAFQAETETLRTSQQKAEAAATIHTQEIEHLREKTSSLQSENEQLTAELASSEEERSEAVVEINRLKDELGKKQQIVQGLEEKLSSLDKTLKKTRREANSQERDSHERIEQLKLGTGKLEERLKQKSRELFQEQASVDDLKRERKQLEREVADLEKTRNNLKTIHESLRSVQEMCS